jgi:D-alanyl-D-alanine carboxypeptidase (penicillin-binding protein 5/6)
MKVAVTYDGPMPAPIRKGDQVGTIRITAPGWPDVQKPLVAAADVEQLGLFGRIGAAIAHFAWGSKG